MCWARAASEAVHQGLPRLCGDGLEEGEGGDHAVLGEGEEACLCDEIVPGGKNQGGGISIRLHAILM